MAGGSASREAEGAESGVAGVVAAGVTIAAAATGEGAEGAGARAGLDELRCQITMARTNVGTAIRIRRRARIVSFYGNLASTGVW